MIKEDKQTEVNLDLWKWFTDDAAHIKDKMWTVAAFFYTLLGALLGFIMKYISANNGLKISEPLITIVGAFIGCFLSGFGIYMLREYGRHIRHVWNRANYMRYNIEGLNEIWCYGDAKRLKDDHDEKSRIDNRLPRIAKRLVALMSFFFVTFLVLLFLFLSNA